MRFELAIYHPQLPAVVVSQPKPVIRVIGYIVLRDVEIRSESFSVFLKPGTPLLESNIKDYYSDNQGNLIHGSVLANEYFLGITN